jgi:hypothetical protein
MHVLLSEHQPVLQLSDSHSAHEVNVVPGSTQEHASAPHAHVPFSGVVGHDAGLCGPAAPTRNAMPHAAHHITSEQ